MDSLLVNEFYNDVNDWLSVGGDLDLAADVTGQTYAETIRQLTAHGVTHVLDLRVEWSNASTWEQMGLPAENYCYAPITDSWRYKPEAEWYAAIEEFIGEFWMNSAEGDRLYVHCHMGINRAPSAAMLALMLVEAMHPWEAFLAIREARPVAGLVYAEAVGSRFFENDPEGLRDFQRLVNDYWTPELNASVRRGIAFYRSKEGGTIEEGRITGAPLSQPSINPALNLGLTP
jgi:protein-tyrosine phosphatase